MQFNLEKQTKPNKQGLNKLKTTCFNHQNNKKQKFDKKKKTISKVYDDSKQKQFLPMHKNCYID